VRNVVFDTTFGTIPLLC